MAHSSERSVTIGQSRTCMEFEENHNRANKSMNSGSLLAFDRRSILPKSDPYPQVYSQVQAKHTAGEEKAGKRRGRQARRRGVVEWQPSVRIAPG
eukprot:jgi/Bigna1/138127/aug1.43_g12835